MARKSEITRPHPAPSARKSRAIGSIAEFARRLDLSAWTVSRAINGHPEVNEKTRQRILHAMDELGFRPNPLAAGLGGRRTNMVGFCFMGLGNPIVDRKIFYLQEFLRGHHLRHLLEVRPRGAEHEISAIQDFQRIRVDGMVLLHSDLDAEASSKIVGDYACVHVDPHHRQRAPSVSVDRMKAMRLLIDHLRAFGHRTFGLLAIDETDVWRWEALLEIARVGRFDPNSAYLIPRGTPKVESDIEQGQLMADALINRPKRPTAFVAMNDHVAMGAIQALRTAGLQVPGDISVTGFDNLDIGRRLRPTLTTIEQNPQQLMERAGTILIEQIALPRNQRGGGALDTVEPLLVIGESTGPAPRRQRRASG